MTNKVVHYFAVQDLKVEIILMNVIVIKETTNSNISFYSLHPYVIPDQFLSNVSA